MLKFNRAAVLFSLLFCIPSFLQANEEASKKLCPVPDIEEFIDDGAIELGTSKLKHSDLEALLESADMYAWVLSVVESGEWVTFRYVTPMSNKGVLVEVQKHSAWVKVAKPDEVVEWNIGVDGLSFSGGVICMAYKYDFYKAITE